MCRKLELVVWPKLRKGIEFGQTLDCLSGVLRENNPELKTDWSENEKSYTILVVWESPEQVNHMIRSKEFSILSGAIAALCDRTEIRLDGEPVGTDIAQLLSMAEDK